MHKSKQQQQLNVTDLLALPSHLLHDPNAASEKTRNYLQSTCFSHVFNLKPLVRAPQFPLDSPAGNNTESTKAKAASPSSDEQSFASLSQPHRHILSKRTRASAQKQQARLLGACKDQSSDDLDK